MTLFTIITLGVLTHTTFTSARMIGSLYALANGASAFTVGVLREGAGTGFQCFNGGRRADVLGVAAPRPVSSDAPLLLQEEVEIPDDGRDALQRAKSVLPSLVDEHCLDRTPDSRCLAAR